jgi:hypothetical protein
VFNVSKFIQNSWNWHLVCNYQDFLWKTIENRSKCFYQTLGVHFTNKLWTQAMQSNFQCKQQLKAIKEIKRTQRICLGSSLISRHRLSSTSPPNSWKSKLRILFEKWFEKVYTRLEDTITIKSWTLIFNPRPNPSFFSNLQRFLVASTRSSPRTQSPTQTLTDSNERSLSQNTLISIEVKILGSCLRESPIPFQPKS